jgi:hypothetical protein
MDDFTLTQIKVSQICDAVKTLTKMDNSNYLKEFEPSIELSIRFDNFHYAEIKLTFKNSTIVSSWVGVGDAKVSAINDLLFRLKKELTDRVNQLNCCIDGIDNISLGGVIR